MISDTEAADIQLVNSRDNSGSGGDIRFAQIGDIVALGERSIALLAQSLGGGGGIVDRRFMGSAGGSGDSGDISLTVYGDVIASGRNGVAIFAQSVSRQRQGDIELTLTEGDLISGGEQGVSLWLSGGDNNRVINRATVAGADGADGMALLSEQGENLLENYGQLIGNIDFGRGQGSVRNHVSGLIAPGSQLQLGGSERLFHNDGALVLGGANRVDVVALNGSYVQSAGASSYAEIDLASGSIDRLESSGGMLLEGHHIVSLLNPGYTAVGEFSQPLFVAEFGVEDRGLLIETPPSAVISYRQPVAQSQGSELAQSEAPLQRLSLSYTVDFSPTAMDKNLRAIGEHINYGQSEGGGTPAYAELISELVYRPDLTAYRQALSQLSPELYGEQQVQMIDSSFDFGQSLMSCRQLAGEYRFSREGSCLWMRSDSLTIERDGHGDYQQLDGDSTRLTVGGQQTFASDWSLGAGISKGRNSTDGYDGRWSSRSDSNHFGLSIKRRQGPEKWAAVLSYGWSESDSNRRLDIIDNVTAASDREMKSLAVGFRYSYDVEKDDWYWRPMLGVGVTHLRVDSTDERGAGGANLALENHSDSHWWLQPAIEVGSEYSLSENYALRLNLNLGVKTYLAGDSTDVKSSFVEGAGDVTPMAVPMELGDPLYSAGVGVELLSRGDSSLQLHYAGSWHDHSDTESLSLKLQVPFF